MTFAFVTSSRGWRKGCEPHNVASLCPPTIADNHVRRPESATFSYNVHSCSLDLSFGCISFGRYIPLPPYRRQNGLSIYWRWCKLQSQFVRRVSRRREPGQTVASMASRHEFATLTQIVVLGGGPGYPAGCQDTRTPVGRLREIAAKNTRTMCARARFFCSTLKPGFRPARCPS